MSDNKIPVSVQKNCEIISIQPEAEEGHYTVKAKFTNATSECVTPFLHVKGSPENIGQIMKCLGEEFAANRLNEEDLENPLLERAVFEIKGKKVIARDQDTDEPILTEDAPEDLDPGKVEEISFRFLRPAANQQDSLETTPVADSVPKIKKLWAETNANRKITKESRIKQKISNLHTFVRHLAEKRGIPQERIDEALDTLSELNNLTEVIGRYRIQYLPELDAELKELQECEECLKHFTIG